jgi:hypothetical protein
MEYLMTYGWAILIIAVVLGALFQLGVFSGASVIGTSCVASSGFLCSSLTYTHTTGVLSVQIGQNTGSNWNAPTYMIFAPQGSPTSGNGPITPSAAYSTIIAGGLVSGQSSSVSWTLGGISVGSTLAGTIWACYAVGSGNSVTGYTYTSGICGGTNPQYTKLAILTAKAT